MKFVSCGQFVNAFGEKKKTAKAENGFFSPKASKNKPTGLRFRLSFIVYRL